MIEINESFRFSGATIDTIIIITVELKLEINPLVMWDILIEEVDKIQDNLKPPFSYGFDDGYDGKI